MTEIKLLEEMVGPCVTIEIQNARITAPASWFVLIYSEETSDVDVIRLYELARGDFTVMIGSPTDYRIKPGYAKLIDYTPKCTTIVPRMNKHQMLCYPLSTDRWISISPYDQYSKTLKGCVTGDFI